MKIVVFLGPSLDRASAEAILEADYRPPVQQGDVLRALADGADVIGIIDGYFHSVPSVWHKEILAAISRGVTVLGSASMGALRAAELHRFGMRGIGRVFEWYRDGVIEDDDEVAVAHGPADMGYRGQSVALVNVRDLLDSATAAQVVDGAVATEILALAKALYYPDRTYPAIFAAARGHGLDRAGLERLEAYRALYGAQVKERDAVALLESIRDESLGPLRREPPRFDLEHTILLESLGNEVAMARAAGVGGLHALDHDAEGPGGELLKVLRKKVLLRRLAVRHAEMLGLEVTSAEVQAMADSFRRRFGLLSRDAMNEWMGRYGVTRAELGQAMAEFCAVKQMELLMRHDVDASMPLHMRIHTARTWNVSGQPIAEGQGPKRVNETNRKGSEAVQ